MTRAAGAHRLASSDSELDRHALERVASGDPGACATFVRQYERRVFALLGRMLNPRGLGSQVEDLAQETFLRAFRALDRFDPNGSAKLSTWLLCIASRLAINLIRRPATPTVALDLELSVPPDQHRIDAAETLRAAIAALSAEQQAALVLREFHGLDDAAIGEALDLQPAAVRARICRARARLRQLMGQEVLS